MVEMISVGREPFSLLTNGLMTTLCSICASAEQFNAPQLAVDCSTAVCQRSRESQLTAAGS